jgi:ankyrin repeat protein
MYHEPSVQFRQRVLEGDVTAARRLLDEGVEVDVINLGGYTALMDAAMNGDRAMLVLLLDRGADIDSVDGTYGESALFHALTSDHADAAGLLMGRGADPWVGRTRPARVAAERDRADWLRVLIEGGLDVNEQERTSQPLLVTAVEERARGVVEVLLESGADPGPTGVEPFSPLRIAVDARLDEITALLISSGAPLDLEMAARAGLVERVRAFLDEGVDPNFIGGWHQTALESAIRGRRLEVVRLLLERGADANLGDSRTPLELAEGGGLTDIAAALRAAGAGGGGSAGDGGSAVSDGSAGDGPGPGDVRSGEDPGSTIP